MIERMMKINRNYYVYKFLDEDGAVIYVGKTKRLEMNYFNRRHLTNKVKKIEYIECHSEAEAAWKKIYYVNLFFNDKSENVKFVYQGDRDHMEDFHFPDKWIEYDDEFGESKNLNNLSEKYEKYVLDLPKYNYENLIHIIDHRKLNAIGNDQYAISQQWFTKHDSDGLVIKLSHHIKNYFMNIIPKQIGVCSTKDCLWTTYDCAVNRMKGKGYTKGFINLYQDYDGTLNGKKYLAFIANPYLPAKRKSTNFEIDSDQFALMELLKFMFQSDLKLGKEIWIYIPSSRMRALLRGWVETKTQKNGI